MSSLNRFDLAMFERFRVEFALLDDAHVHRVTDAEAQKCGFTGGKYDDLDGIVFPYLSLAGQPINARLRLDNPPMVAGKPDGKYRSLPDNRDAYM